MSRDRLRMVIFDCDGVLVDSEPVASRVTAALLTECGWAMTPEQAHAQFLGMSLPDMRPLIEARIGALPAGFETTLAQRLAAAMRRECAQVPGAEAVLRATTALGLPWRIASNSSHAEMAAKFAVGGLATLVEGRVHSFEDLAAHGGRGKPAPDIFLAAAAAEGIPPAACLVVEDSATGVRGATAAGMECIGFDPGGPFRGNGDLLRAAGAALVVDRLAALPALFRARMAGRMAEPGAGTAA